MAHCIECGREVSGQRWCHECLNKWSKMKAMLFDEAVAKFGKLGPDTLPMIQKYVKQAQSRAKRQHERGWIDALLAEGRARAVKEQ